MQILLQETVRGGYVAYPDLNPIRACIAAPSEASDFTSVKEWMEDPAAAGEALTSNAQDA